MTHLVFDIITRWQKETFPQATALSKAYHLRQEVDELIKALEDGDGGVDFEYADCIMLLYGSASENGLTYKDIDEALFEKFKINLTRKWGRPDENGVVKHIED